MDVHVELFTVLQRPYSAKRREATLRSAWAMVRARVRVRVRVSLRLRLRLKLRAFETSAPFCTLIA